MAATALLREERLIKTVLERATIAQPIVNNNKAGSVYRSEAY